MPARQRARQGRGHFRDREQPMMRHRLSALISAALIGLLAWSSIHAYDRPTWLLEVVPVLIVLTVLWLTSRRFPLTPLLYWLILAHAIVLIVGEMYTYAPCHGAFNCRSGWA